MTNDELQTLKKQAGDITNPGSPNKYPVLIALIQAKAVEKAGAQIAESLDFVAREITAAGVLVARG